MNGTLSNLYIQQNSFKRKKHTCVKRFQIVSSPTASPALAHLTGVGVPKKIIQ